MKRNPLMSNLNYQNFFKISLLILCMGLFDVIGTAPANVTNNDEQSITLAVGYRYHIKSINGQIVATGVANRYISYTFEDANGKIFFRIGNTTVITDGLTGIFTVGEGMENKALGNTVDVGQLPDDFVVEGGTVIKTATIASDALDRWGEMNIFGQKLVMH